MFLSDQNFLYLERHLTACETVGAIVIGFRSFDSSLRPPSGFIGAISSIDIIVTAGLTEIAAFVIAQVFQ